MLVGKTAGGKAGNSVGAMVVNDVVGNSVGKIVERRSRESNGWAYDRECELRVRSAELSSRSRANSIHLVLLPNTGTAVGGAPIEERCGTSRK